MILRAFQYGPLAPVIRAAPPNRAWMDAFQDRHAYRCLPLSIANVFGWELLSPCDVLVDWNGGEAKEDLKVGTPDGDPLIEHFAASNFSRGILTLHLGYIFRTEPDWSLLATGPINRPVDGMSPLTGIIETDWLPYPFTMNWQVTAPGTFRINRGEPFCHILPVRQAVLEDTRLEIATMAAEPGLKERQDAFAARRKELMDNAAAAGPDDPRPAGWGREYFRGQLADGFAAPRHTHKLRLAEPVDLRETQAAPSASSAPEDVATFPTFGRSSAPRPAEEEPGWWSGDPSSLPVREPESGPNLLAVPGFLSPDQCAMLREAFGSSLHRLGKNPQGESFWDECVLWFDQVDPSCSHARAVMQQARFVAAYRIAEHFGLDRRLYSDSQQLVLWKEGRGMPVHVDNAHPDGSRHNTPHREFASIVYLNDDYEGGEAFFPRLGCRIKPSAGLLVAFRGTHEAPHGVTTVTSGDRYTMPSWYSTDPKVAEGSMFNIL